MQSNQMILVSIFLIYAVVVWIATDLTLKKRPPAKYGVMRFGRWMVMLAWACLGFACLSVIHYMNYPSGNNLFGMVGLVLGCGWGFLYLFSTKMVFTEKYFESTSWVTFADVHLWKDLLCIEYDRGGSGGGSYRSASYTLEFSDKDVSIHPSMENIDQLFELLEQKGYELPSEYKKSRGQIEDVCR